MAVELWSVPSTADEVEPPDDDDLSADWQESIAPDYAGILSARDASDPDLVASGIAAAVLLAGWLFDGDRAVYLKPGRRRSALLQGELEQILEQRSSVTRRALDKISTAYANKRIDAEEWGDQAGSEILTLHSQAFILGRGGVGQMSDSDRALLGQILTFHQSKLSDFQGVLDTLSSLQAQNRLRMYASSATGSFWAGYELAATEAGFTHSQRFLGAAEHCPDCQGYAAQGRQAIGLLPPPCVACQCGHNCKCRLEYS